ncbi:NACHT domain-containing NTPase [Neochlamydia sp. S13]|uniref:NACHT domain-containing protein n=1 Tax=Neochlamydia sp. S13 TaxID=1353976 RepID=UPI0005AB0764|nr:NACHT domain-containing protein [Neochlamydia sp. S13]BBI17721.1 hypothetical protein NCS13_1_1526 [Neochlamydia sp. S13]
MQVDSNNSAALTSQDLSTTDYVGSHILQKWQWGENKENKVSLKVDAEHTDIIGTKVIFGNHPEGKKKYEATSEFTIKAKTAAPLLIESPESFKLLAINSGTDGRFNVKFLLKDKVFFSTRAPTISNPPPLLPAPEIITRGLSSSFEPLSPSIIVVPPQYVNTPPLQPFDFYSFNNARDLALAYLKGYEHPLIPRIIQHMVDSFQELTNPRGDFVEEIMVIIELLEPNQRNSILERLVQNVDEEIIKTPLFLEALTSFFQNFQRSAYRKAIAESRDSEALEKKLNSHPFSTLEADHFIKIMNMLLHRLEETSLATSIANNADILVTQLEAFSSLLEIMEMTAIRNLEEKDREKFPHTVDRYRRHSNLSVAFFAEYSTQIFRCISQQTSISPFLQRVNKILNNFKALANQNPSETGMIDKFLKIFEVQEENSWYIQLFILRYLFMQEDVSFLTAFKAYLDTALKERTDDVIQLALPTHHPFFLKGLVEILRQILIHYASIEPEAGKTAILFLQQICGDNFPDKPDKQAPLKLRMDTLIDIESSIKLQELYRKQLREEIIDFLKKCAVTHPVYAMRQIAQASLICELEPSFNPNTMPSSVPNKLNQFPHDLFNEAVRKVAPWFKGFQDIKANTQNDIQLKQDESYYLPVEAKKSLFRKPKELAKKIDKFLHKPTDKVLLIEGAMGSGKSLSIRKFAWDCWKEDPSQYYVPIVVSLPSLKDPHQMVRETLKEHHLQDHELELRKMNILWICDAYDELKIGAKSNLYQINRFNQWSQSKVIFTCRSGYLDKTDKANFWPFPGDDRGLKELQIVPFTKDKRDAYLEQYLKVCREEGHPSLWDQDDYVKYLDDHPQLVEIIEQPLFLRIMADTLPHIVNLHKKTKKDPEIDFTENMFLAASFCRIILREEEKLRRTRRPAHESLEWLPSRVEYLSYYINVARGMQAYAWKAHPELRYTDKNRDQTFFSLEDPMVNQSLSDVTDGQLNESLAYLFSAGRQEKKAEQFRRCGLLIEINKKWGFRHESFYKFFIYLDTTQGDREQVASQLSEDKFDFGSTLQLARVL